MDRAARQLLVLRHAKSAWPEGVADRDRPLSGRGERAARRIGQFLAAQGLVPGAALVSPARRAADTARLVLAAADAEVSTDVDERIYGGDAAAAVSEALAALGALSSGVSRLLVVGHEPEMADLIARVSGADVRLPTAGLAWLHLDGDRLDGGRLALLTTPKLLGVD